MARVTIRSIGVSRDAAGRYRDRDSGRYLKAAVVERRLDRERDRREVAERAEARAEAARRGWETRRAKAEADRAERADVGRAVRADRDRAAARREPAEPAAPSLARFKPLSDYGEAEAAKLRERALEKWAAAGDTSGRARDRLVMHARSLEASADRAERGAIAASKKDVRLSDPIALRGDFTRWRDRRGRWCVAGTRGARPVIHFSTALGELGERVQPFIRALRDFQRAGFSWGHLTEKYYRRAVALGLVG